MGSDSQSEDIYIPREAYLVFCNVLMQYGRCEVVEYGMPSVGLHYPTLACIGLKVLTSKHR